MNGFLDRCYVREIVFGTFPTRHDQRWTDEAHQRTVLLAVGGDGIQQVRVVLELTTLDRKHGFQVSDLNIDENIEPGRVTRVRIVPGQTGTFLFHCDVFCGSGHEDMAGEIVVKP